MNSLHMKALFLVENSLKIVAQNLGCLEANSVDMRFIAEVGCSDYLLVSARIRAFERGAVDGIGQIWVSTAVVKICTFFYAEG